MIDAVLERLTRLHPKVIDLSLDRVLRLLDALGNPQDKLPPRLGAARTVFPKPRRSRRDSQVRN